jgi:dUTPase
MLEIHYKKIKKDGWIEPVAPFHAHNDDRGFDLVCVAKEPAKDDEGNEIPNVWRYHSGLAFQFPDGLDAEFRARSSVYKTGLILSNGVGTINYYSVNGAPANVIIQNKTWYHIAQVRHNNTVMFFLDGIMVDSREFTQNVGDAAGTIRIGGGPDWDGWPWWGKMADVRISNVARYTSNFTPLTRCVYTLN